MGLAHPSGPAGALSHCPLWAAHPPHCFSLLYVVMGEDVEREPVCTEESFLVLFLHVCSYLQSTHSAAATLALGKNTYALGRLLSSGKSPYLILRLICQLDIFLLCLLPAWKEINMKRCCVVETPIFRGKQCCSYQK